MTRKILSIAAAAASVLMSLAACGETDKPSAGGNGGNGGGSAVTDLNVPDKEGAMVKGIVINAKTRAAMPDVVVSDGRLCTRTDANGMYWLNTDFSTQRCVFVCVPNGYEIPVDADFCFGGYKKIDLDKKDEVQQFNFALEPMTVSSLHYKVLYVGDPQIRKDMAGSYESYTKVINALAEYKKESDVPVYMVNVGDLTYERPQEHAYFKDQIAMTQIPTFNVPGNHDHIGPLNKNSGLIPSTLVDDPAKHTNDYVAVSGYIRDFGPNNYSANIGSVHYLFLDTIIWNEIDTPHPDADKGVTWDGDARWHYCEGFDDETLEFIENDLLYVDKTTPLCIVTHGPAARMLNSGGENDASWLRNYDKFKSLVSGYKVQNWSGHIHTGYNYSYSAGENGFQSMESHQIARATGTLYMENEINTDGVPRGFIVADVDGQNITWEYKRAEPAEKNGNDQMQIYTPDETGNGYVYVNVFLHDNIWGTPEWYENGTRKGSMTEYHADGDPAYRNAWNEWLVTPGGNEEQKKQRLGEPGPNDTRHLFRIKPSDGVTSGEVRITDRFNHEWTQACEW